MLDFNQAGRWLFVVGAGLFGLSLTAGIVQSLRVDGRFPAVDLFGNGSRAYIERLIADEQYDGAIEQLRMQSQMQPYDADLVEHLAHLLGSRGRLEEARSQFKKLVELRPDDPKAHFYLGTSCNDTNRPELAVLSFEQSVRLDSEYAAAFNGLGVAWARLGELAIAEECFARAVELEPNYKDARINLERARRELGIKP